MEIRWKYNGNRIEIARVYLPTEGKLGEIGDSIRISMVFQEAYLSTYFRLSSKSYKMRFLV